MSLSPEEFEAKTEEQEVLGNSIVAYLNDFNKSNKQRRRNHAFLRKVYEKSKEFYTKFKDNHEILKNYPDQTGEYFSSKYFDNISKLFNNIFPKVNELADELLKPNHESTRSDETGLESFKVEDFEYVDDVEARDVLLRLIRKQHTNFLNIKTHCQRSSETNFGTSDEIDFWVHKLNGKLENISSLHSEITSLVDPINPEYPMNYSQEQYFELENRVSTVLYTLLQKKSELKTKESAKRSLNRSETDLPKIDLPQFDGSIENWSKFHDLFTDIIHKSNKSNAYKFYYLKSKLIGKAASLISSKNTNADNYETVWNRIVDKYENKKDLIFDAYDKLFNQKNVKEDNPSNLRDLHDTCKENILLLEDYNVKFDGCESAIVFLLLNKIDKKNRELYEASLVNKKEAPKLADFFKFLDERAQILHNISKISKIASKEDTSVKHIKHLAIKTVNTVATVEGCPACDASHKLYECSKFKAFDIKQRWEFVKSHKICGNCLREGHFRDNCIWKGGCPVQNCGKRHNSLLHTAANNKNKSNGQGNTKQINKRSTSDQSTSGQPKGDVSLITNNCNVSASSKKQEDKFIFLGTALLHVEDNHKNKIECRALLDTGSQVNLISQKLANKLGINPSKQRSAIMGVGINSVTTSNKINISISSLNGTYYSNIEAIIIPQITSYAPSENIDKQNKVFSGFQLADPQFNQPGCIDILLGNELNMELDKNNVKLGNGMPFIKDTMLGWVVGGKYDRSSCESYFCGITLEHDFNMNAPKLWELENFPENEQKGTAEEIIVEEHFTKTTKNNKNGKFIVELPKISELVLGDSYKIALRRFQFLEKKFAKDPSLHQEYHNFLDEYLKLGHMTKTQWAEIPKEHYFLPHHAVLKSSSITTKLRVVFDGSCKTSNNISLNNKLMKGPTIQKDIFEILINFRTFEFAVSADIEKMYRQVLISESDQYFQLILWRNSPKDEVSIYKLATVTYGTTSAAYLATRCLKEIAIRNANDFPLAADVLLNDFYVDDLLTGFDSIEVAKKVQSDLIGMLHRGGFNLRKWCSNNPALLLEQQNEDPNLHINYKSSIHDNDQIKALGVIWNNEADKLLIAVPRLDPCSRLSKRIITAESGMLFDPLGLVNPCVMIAKLVIQKLWEEKLDWDEEVPNDIKIVWENFRSQVYLLENISVPRNVLIKNCKSIQLHGFADASKTAYGAVIYIRSVDSDNNISIRFLCSKSKVSPSSKNKGESSNIATIPKLELSAAKLLVSLVKRVKSIFKKDIESTFLWSDSKIVLSWITKPASTFKQFVSNRVKFIQENSNIDDWYHIDGKMNPADIVSRGKLPKDLISSKLWFHGPEFLSTNQADWNLDIETDVISESMVVNAISTSENEESFIDKINHRNSFDTLKRIIGYVLRFINTTKTKKKPDSLTLSANELEQSEFKIIENIQNFHKLKNEINKSLTALMPFIDEKNILRVGGRLQNSNLAFEAKHQILLPKCNITKLIINKVHLQNYHSGPATLLALIRQKYWPLDGKRLCTKAVHDCIRCFRLKPKLMTQLMGSLPSTRVTPLPAFSYTGVDFAGPLILHHNIRGKRPTKAYLSVFVCFTTKAVHLDIVADLTTKAFLLCLRRFISRRGKPVRIYSDNATNFIGAKEELKVLQVFLDQNRDDIVKFTANRNIDWLTIPARSPHFGGLWESSVKSAKNHLKELINTAQLNYDEMRTAIIEVESILNNRPITNMSDDPNDLRALTPSSFLIPGNSSVIPIKKGNMDRKKLHLTNRYDLICQIANECWERFSLEYLQTLQKRAKWTRKMKNIEINTLVLLRDSNLPSLKWKLGRIVKVFKGNDDLVRVVDVKTENNILRRAINQVAPLPTLTDEVSENYLESLTNNEYNNKTNCKEIISQELNKNNVRAPNTNKNVNCKNGIFSITNMLTLIFYMILIIPLVLGEDSNDYINITRFSDHPGLYFDGIGKVNIMKDKWHMMTYYNMTGYWKQADEFNLLINQLKPLCQLPHCVQNIKVIEDQIGEINDLNELIQEECHLREMVRSKRISRSKRSYQAPLNVIGNIAHLAFGVLDSNYASNMESVLKNVKSNQDRLFLMIKNHTSIIDNTVKLMKENNQEIKATFQNIQGNIANMVKNINIQEKQIHFNTLISYVTLVIGKYRETQLQLHNVLKDFKKGRLNPLLIKPREFEEHLTSIEKIIGNNAIIPSSHFAELESIVQLAVIHSETSLIFQIEIPLLRKQQFNLYRMVPVPTVKSNMFIYIQPSSDYVAISGSKDSYYFLSKYEYDRCRQFFEILLCEQDEVLYSIDSNNNHCEINLYLNINNLNEHCELRHALQSQYWVELNEENSWLYSVENRVPMRVKCGSDIFYMKTLEGEGKIKFKPECDVDASGIQIPGKIIKFSKLLLRKVPEFLPSINISTEIKTANISIPIVLKLKNTAGILKSISVQKLQEERELSDLDMKDILYYTSFGLTGSLIVILLIGIIIVIKKRKAKKPRNNASRRFQVEDIEQTH